MIYSAWLVGIAVQAWSQGISQGQWPPPYAFLDLTVVMLGAALVGHANPKAGALLAWGMLLPLLLINLQEGAQGRGPLTTLPIAQSGGGVKAVPTAQVVQGG